MDLSSINWLDVIGLFLFLAGFIIGLGAVTVIDVHGLLARRSTYWTETTVRTHKVTKPLIWFGICLLLIGGAIFYRAEPFIGIPRLQAIIALVIILNGLFLSFSVSPFLLKREKAGRSDEILPLAWQRKITVSFLLSVCGWWGGLFLLVLYLISHLP